MNHEARPFGLEINWDKTEIQSTVQIYDLQQILVAGNPVQLVEKFTHLESQLDYSVGSESETLGALQLAGNARRSALVRQYACIQLTISHFFCMDLRCGPDYDQSS